MKAKSSEKAEERRESPQVESDSRAGGRDDVRGEAREAREEKQEKEVDIGSPIVYRLKNQIYAGIVTEKTGDRIDLVYFSGKGSGASTGAVRVEKGLRHGQWWANAQDVRVALAENI